MPRTRGRRRRREQRLAGRQATKAHFDARHRADPPPHTIGRRQCRCCRRTRPERTSTGRRALVSRSRDRTSSTPRRVDRAPGTSHNGGFASWGSGCDFGALSSIFWPFSPLLRLDAAAAATHGQGARMGVGMSARRPLLQLGSLSCSIKTPQSDLIS